MKTRLVLSLGIVAGLALFFLWPRGIAYTNFPPGAGTTWVAFGDSLTSGYGASAEGRDYPAVLSQRLGVPIVNMGVSGHTSADGLARVDEVLQLNPRVVLLCFGGNDTLNGVPHDQTFSQLTQMIDRLQQHGAFVVLIGIRTASVRDRYHSQFKKLAKEKKVFFVPNILHGILGNPALMSDYIHPNDDGYTAIAQRLELALEPLLPVLAPTR